MSDLETEFNNLVQRMYQDIQTRLDNGEITYQMAQSLRFVVTERFSSPRKLVAETTGDSDLPAHVTPTYEDIMPDEFDRYYDTGWNSSSVDCL